MSKVFDSSQREVTLSHGRTRYFDYGAGPTVVLLHGVGFTAGGTSWYRNLERLGDGLRVLAPDIVGWGTGDRLEQGYAFAYLVDFVREFQDALGITSSHVLGHSMGGWVASLLAYESPDRIDRLVLTASGGVATRTLAQMTEFQPPTKQETYDRIAALPEITPAEAADWTEYDWANAETPGALDAYRKILAHMNVAETRARYNTQRRLPHVGAETLVLWGTDDAVNSMELGEKMAELVPKARLETFSCGHMVPHEAPREFNEAVLNFLG